MTALRIGVSAGLLAALALTVDYTLLGSLVRRMQPAYLAVLLGVSLGRLWLLALRFRCLARPRPVSTGSLVGQYFIGAYASNFLPSVHGGDLVRFFLLKRSGFPGREALALIVLERLIGLYALVALALLGAQLFELPREIRAAVFGLAAVLAILGMLLWLTPGRLERHLARFRVLEGWTGVLSLGARGAALGGAFLWSIPLQVAAVAISWLIGEALGLAIPFAAYLALVPIVWIVTMVPVSLGGIGLREASFAVLFSQIGVASEAGLLVGLGTYAAILIPGLVGAVLAAHQGLGRRIPGAGA